MSYSTQARIAQDAQLRLRVAAALAGENVEEPLARADALMWRLATTKGWDTAYETSDASSGALARLGSREDVITDRMIRAAVRDALTATAVGGV